MKAMMKQHILTTTRDTMIGFLGLGATQALKDLSLVLSVFVAAATLTYLVLQICKAIRDWRNDA